VAVLTFAYAVAFVHRIGMSLLVEPMQADLGLNDTDIGLLMGVLFAVPYTLGGPVLGWLADAFSRRMLLAAAATIWAATTAACGFAGSFATLATLRFGSGLSQSALQPAAASMIADCFRAEMRSKAYGVFVAGTAIGTAAAYWLGAMALGVGEWVASASGLRSWSGAFLSLGAIGLLVPVALALIREPVRQERLESGKPDLHVTVQFLRRHWFVVWSLNFGIAICFLAPYGQLAFMPVMFSRSYGWNPAQLATVFGVVAIIAGGLGSVSAGWLAARLAKRGVADSDWLVCGIGAAGSLLPGTVAPLMPTAVLSLVMFSLSGFFSNWPGVGALAVLNRIAPNEMRGQMTALYTSTVGLIGAGLGPVVVGTLSDHLPGRFGNVAYAMSMTFLICSLLSVTLLAAGRRPFLKLMSAASLEQAA